MAKEIGHFILTQLASGNIAPSTSGLTKMVIVDENGLFSFDDIPVGGGGGDYTDEQAQDAVGTILNSGEFTYSDSTPSIIINAIAAAKVTETSTKRFITDTERTNWQSAYNNMIVSGAVTGTTTKTITLTQQDGGTVTFNFTDETGTVSAPTDQVMYGTGSSYSSNANFKWALNGIGSNINAINLNGTSGSGVQMFTNGVLSGYLYSWINNVFLQSASDINLVPNAGAGSVIHSGKTGIGGVTSPTARLHLAAGSATANTAPLKINTGTALTTPEDGALEYHSSHLYFTIGSTRYQLDQQGGGGGSTALSALTAATGSNTINSAAHAQEWQWNSLSTGAGIKFSSSSTAAAGGTQRVVDIINSGANGSSGQTTYGLFVQNTKTGGSSTNISLYSSATGATNNHAAHFESGSVTIGSISSPIYPLQVNLNSSGFVPGAMINNTSTNTVSYSQIAFNSNARIWGVGVGNNSETLFGVANKFIIYDQTANLMRLIINSAGEFTLPSYASGSTAPTTSGTKHMLTVDSNGLISHEVIPSGGAGASATLDEFVYGTGSGITSSANFKQSSAIGSGITTVDLNGSTGSGVAMRVEGVIKGYNYVYTDGDYYLTAVDDMHFIVASGGKYFLPQLASGETTPTPTGTEHMVTIDASGALGHRTISSGGGGGASAPTNEIVFGDSGTGVQSSALYKVGSAIGSDIGSLEVNGVSGSGIAMKTNGTLKGYLYTYSDGDTYLTAVENLHFVLPSGGNISIPEYASGNTAPTTSGAKHMITVDANGLLSHEAIPSGGGSITGTDTHVMFFDGANNPAGDAGMTYNKTTDALSVTGGMSSKQFIVVGDDTVNIKGLQLREQTGSTAIATTTEGIVYMGIGGQLKYNYNTIDSVVVLDNVIQTISGAKTFSSDTFVANNAGLVIGHAAQLTIAGIVPEFQMHGTAAADSTMVLGRSSTTNSDAPEFIFFKSGDASIGSATVVASGEVLGKISAYGTQQTGSFSNQNIAAQIRFEVGTTVSSGSGVDMPGRIVFATSRDGTGGLTDRLRITHTGDGSTTAGVFEPASNGLMNLGSSSGNQFGSLYLVEGGEVSFGGGSTRILSVAASDSIQFLSGSSYRFDAPITPLSDGSTSIGTGTLGWQNIHLNTLGTINFEGGNVVWTHSTGLMTLSAGNLAVTNLSSGGSAPSTSGTTKMVVTDANGKLSFKTEPVGTYVATDGFTSSNETISLGTEDVSSPSSGVLHVQVAGITAGGDSITRSFHVRFKSASGVVTVASENDISAVQKDSAVSSASVTMDVSGSTLRIRATGQTSVPIQWKSTHIMNRAVWVA